MKKWIFLLTLIPFQQYIAITPYNIRLKNPISILYDFIRQVKEAKSDQENEMIGTFGLAASINNDAFIKNVNQLLKKAFPEATS